MTLDKITDPVAAYVSDFRRRRVLVVGDAILDEYLLGECSRISPEAPVPVLKVNTARRVLGGAANTAANIVSLGGSATLIALVGNDEGGRTMKRCARGSRGRAAPSITGRDTPQDARCRSAAANRQARLRGYPAALPSIESTSWLFSACVGECDIVVISDYAKVFLALLAQEIIRVARSRASVIVDPRPQNRDAIAVATT